MAGLDGKAGHFGRSDGTGAKILMADGECGSHEPQISPDVLAALSTPDGNDAEALPRKQDSIKDSKKVAPVAPPKVVTDRDRFSDKYRIHAPEVFLLVVPPDFRDEVLLSGGECNAMIYDFFGVHVAQYHDPQWMKFVNKEWMTQMQPRNSHGGRVQCLFVQTSSCLTPMETCSCCLRQQRNLLLRI